jgi:hypothetical protein
METVCVEIKDFEEIENDLREALGNLRDDLIGDQLLWI